VTIADSGYIKVTPDETSMIMVLYNGNTFTELEEKNVIPAERKYPSRKDSFKEQTLVLSLTGFDLERSNNEMFRSNSWSKNMAQLSKDIDSLDKRYNIKQNSQYKEFRGFKIYEGRNQIAGYAVQTDTSKALVKTVKFDAKALFAGLTNEEKKTALSKALEDLKDASNFVQGKSETMKMEVRSLKRYEVDWHKKLTLPFACLIFFFIGAPLGAIIRKGGLGTPAVISIFFFVIWYVITITGEKMVEEDLVSSTAGMWASSLILLPVGIFLTYKASNDSVILNIDTYISFLRRIKDYLYRITIQGNAKNPDNITTDDE
jgi:lipopolysaccharide export system permease protein